VLLHAVALALVCMLLPLPATAQSNSTATSEPDCTSASTAPPVSLTVPGSIGGLIMSAELTPDTFTVWHGVVRAGGANRRATSDVNAGILGQIAPGTPIRIDQWVEGSMAYPDVITWGQVDPADGGGYVFGGTLAGVLPPIVPPVPATMQGRTDTWLDVNLTLNVLTAYSGGQPLKSILVSPGRPGHTTDLGQFAITSKVPSQEMVGPGYDVPDVPSVQYFSGGEALHGRYWTLPATVGTTSSNVAPDGSLPNQDTASQIGTGPNTGVAFGVPSSHGCLGMQVDDAAWLYSLTPIGTVVDVHT
jgi:hypothetical protein